MSLVDIEAAEIAPPALPDLPAMAPARAIGIPTAVSADLMRPMSKGADVLLLTLVGLVLCFLAWSAQASLQEVTTGRGRVIPASKIQLVQNLEGGIVREILVHEGAVVREGDIILRIDPTLAGSSLGEAREKILGLKALIARLEAETDSTPLAFPDDVLERPDLANHQRELYEARKKEVESASGGLDLQEKQRAQEILELEAKIQNLTRAASLAQEELEMVRPLEKTKAASRSEVLQIEQRTNDIQGNLRAAELALPRVRAAMQEVGDRRNEKLSAYRGESLQKLAGARVELSALNESSRSSADKVSRTTVRAPVSGIVKTVHVTTTGQVVQPGSSLIEIVPLNDSLLIEAQVRPQDIAFVRPGQEALVKITAYDFSVYGGLKARVEQIGADSIATDKGDIYYLIRVRTDETFLKYRGEMLPIIPGMVADVDILTGKKTVLTYLTKPLTRMRDVAMRER
jgi:adhesin transport system membrane fusion protein